MVVMTPITEPAIPAIRAERIGPNLSPAGADRMALTQNPIPTSPNAAPAAFAEPRLVSWPLNMFSGLASSHDLTFL